MFLSIIYDNGTEMAYSVPDLTGPVTNLEVLAQPLGHYVPADVRSWPETETQARGRGSLRGW